MKKVNFFAFVSIRVLMAIGMLCLSLAHGITTETGKSFFAPQPLSSMLAPFTETFQNFAQGVDVQDAPRFSLNISPFYLQSSNAKELRRYFMPEGKDQLVIKGSQAPGTFDISGTWLKIAAHGANHNIELFDNSFASTFSISPQYKFFGVALHGAKHFGSFWVDVMLPVAQARFDLGSNEIISNSAIDSLDNVHEFQPVAGLIVFGGGAPETSKTEVPSDLFVLSGQQALQHHLWRYAKWSSDVLKKTGCGDLHLRIGVGQEKLHGFLKIVMPLSDKQRNEYIFEPQLGNGSCWGFGAGMGGQLNKEFDSWVSKGSLQGNCSYMRLLGNTQMRTFDIAPYGVLSRYLMIKSQQEDLIGTGGAEGHNYTAFGANALTRAVNVSAQGIFEGMLAASLTVANIDMGIRYNLYHAEQEKLSFRENFPMRTGVAHATGEYDNSFVTRHFFANPRINVHGNNQNAAAMVNVPDRILTNEDLDLNTATRPSCTKNSLSFSCSFKDMWHGSPVQCGVISGICLGGIGGLSDWFMGLSLSMAV